MLGLAVGMFVATKGAGVHMCCALECTGGCCHGGFRLLPAPIKVFDLTAQPGQITIAGMNGLAGQRLPLGVGPGGMYAAVSSCACWSSIASCFRSLSSSWRSWAGHSLTAAGTSFSSLPSRDEKGLGFSATAISALQVLATACVSAMAEPRSGLHGVQWHKSLA